MFCLFTICVSVFVGLVSGNALRAGTCPPVTPKNDFSWEQVIGRKWYLQRSIQEVRHACISEVYLENDDGGFDFMRTRLNLETNEYERNVIIGNAFVDENHPGQFTFHPVVEDIDVPSFLLDFKPDEYLLVYSCNEIPDDNEHIVQAFMFTRQPDGMLSQQQQDHVAHLLPNYNIGLDDFDVIDQSRETCDVMDDRKRLLNLLRRYLH